MTIYPLDIEVMNAARQVLNDAWAQTVREFKISMVKFIQWLIEHFERARLRLRHFEQERLLLEHLQKNRSLLEPFESDRSLPALVKSIVYLTRHFFPVLETAEGYWGLVRPDGSHKPAFDALSERYASCR